jgi:hypothetical protein
MMRGVWVNRQTDVQSWQGLKDLQVTHVFYDLHQHTRREFDNARAQGFAVGAYTNPEWFPTAAAAASIDERAKAYRTIVSQRLTALSLHDEQCEVQFNIEKGGLASVGIAADMPAQNLYVRRLMFWWRRSNAQRQTSWTMEGGQGGWFFEAMRSAELANVTLAPQAYHGDMSRPDYRWDTYGIVRDLVDWGVPYERVLPFYDSPELRTAYNGPGYYYFEHRLYS